MNRKQIHVADEPVILVRFLESVYRASFWSCGLFEGSGAELLNSLVELQDCLEKPISPAAFVHRWWKYLLPAWACISSSSSTLYSHIHHHHVFAPSNNKFRYSTDHYPWWLQKSTVLMGQCGTEGYEPAVFWPVASYGHESPNMSLSIAYFTHFCGPECILLCQKNNNKPCAARAFPQTPLEELATYSWNPLVSLGGARPRWRLDHCTFDAESGSAPSISAYTCCDHSHSALYYTKGLCT